MSAGKNKLEMSIANQHYTDVNPVMCGWENCAPCHSYGPVVRLYYMLHFVDYGCGRVLAPEGTIAVNPGEAFIIRPGESITYCADTQHPWRYIWIGFTCTVPPPQLLLEKRVVSLPALRPIFQMMPEAGNMTVGREMYLTGLVFQLLSVLSAGETKARDYMNEARSYIDANYMCNISVQEISRRLCLNRSYLSTLFKKKTGMTLQGYIVKCRMENACTLMRSLGRTPGEAAQNVGYSDVFAFSKAFRHYYGITPTEFIKRCSESEQK